MIINHNMPALNTYRQLSANNTNSAKSLEKLSSGLRINRAGDDAAGLAISEKMRAQVRGLDQAARNAQDGISLIQTAEGGLNETHSILQRMRELAVQSANDTNTDTDRAEIQKEIDQLATEITRISDTTEFNTKKLLNGDMGIKATNTGNAANLKAFAVTGNVADGAYSFALTAVGADSVAMGTNSVASTGVAGDYTIDASNSVSYGTYTLKTSNLTATTADVELFDQNGKSVAKQVGANLNTNFNNFGGFDLDFSAHNINAEGTLQLTVQNAGVNVTVTKPDASTQATGAIVLDDSNQGKFSLAGFEFTIDVSHGAAATTATYNVASKAATFHIGANEDQNAQLAINAMGAADLAVNNVDVKTQAGANAAITTIQSAIDKVSSERAKLGAMQNRLEHTTSNLGASSENLTAAESRVRDVDMAKEMMNFQKNSILSQAAQAMLAQANQQPQGVLQLLR